LWKCFNRGAVEFAECVRCLLWHFSAAVIAVMGADHTNKVERYIDQSCLCITLLRSFYRRWFHFTSESVVNDFEPFKVLRNKLFQHRCLDIKAVFFLFKKTG